MNKHRLNANFAAAILVVSAVIILAILPIQIEFVPTSADSEPLSLVPDSVTTANNELDAEAVNVANTAQQGEVVEFTLQTIVGGDPAMAYVGVGGDIDGVMNPELEVNVGDTVRLTVINGDPVLHDLVIDEFGVDTGDLQAAEETVVVEFVAEQPGEFEYYCSIPGHRDIGMKGLIKVVGEADEAVADAGYGGAVDSDSADVLTAEVAAEDAVSVIRHPSDLPEPLNNDGEPEHHVVEMSTVEVNGVLGDGSTYRYMTFDGQVPGPMLRMTVGDTMEVRLHNEDDSQLPHSIDLHSVTGPGGGAVYTQTMPGDTTSFEFQALNPGLYVYHCATSSVAHHITSGMYGLILVEPEGGLSPVDHEFYVMQGEMYTAQPFGTEGHLDFSYEKMLDEDPEYYVFNGAAGALTQEDYMMQAEVGDSVRIFFGVGGPNKTSSLHMIGEIFDRVYSDASITAEPLTDVQTTLVAPGGATMVEFDVDVPGNYILVDHALSRLERGLVGFLNVEGEDQPDIFYSEGELDTEGH